MFFYLHNWITGHIFTSVSARFAIYIPLFLPISFTYLRLFLPGLRSTFPCSCPSVSHIHVCFCQVCDLHSPVPAHQFHIFTSVSARFPIYIPLFLPISFTYSRLFLPGLRSTFPCSCPSVSPCWPHCGRRISGGEGKTNQNKSDNTTLHTASFCIMNCFV